MRIKLEWLLEKLILSKTKNKNKNKDYKQSVNLSKGKQKM